MLRNGGRYAGLILGTGALLSLTDIGSPPIPLPEALQNTNEQRQYLIEDRALERSVWEQLLARKDVVLCLVWFFVTAGPTTTLPADFNTASNQINVIGNGAGGFGGSAGGTSCGGSGSGC